MNTINEVMKLVTTTNGAVLAGAAFVLGVIVQCLLCKLFKPCEKKQCNRKAQSRKTADEDRPFEKRKPHPAPADGSVEIYVGNLSYDMSEDQLRELFGAYGTVNHCRLVINRYNGKSKGFGFVQMPNRAEAEKACAELNDKDIQGRRIKCNEAKNLI